MNALARDAWDWLERELDHWHEAGIRARFWWRDDDASAPCDELSRLLSLSQHAAVPLALAVIPAACEDALATELQPLSRVAVLQHGYAHRNHARPGELKLELGGNRGSDDLDHDIRLGFERLSERFARQFCPVMVPPWNRIDADVLERLTQFGLRGLSTYRVRKHARPAPGLLQVNTHLDPVHWRRHGGFIGVYPAIAILVQDLIAKRSGYRDRNEPTGILSHHLAYNEATWRFTGDLLGFLSAHPAVEWLDARQIWQSA
jgi:hypothetical protein